jgi:hypothetical protein
VRSAPLEPHDEPTTEDLDRIEREWPLIEAEIALVDAEIRVLTATNGPTALDWRRLRRAEQRVLRRAAFVLAELVTSGADPGAPAEPVTPTGTTAAQVTRNAELGEVAA